MEARDLLRLLQHIIVWIPCNNPIRAEVQDIINRIRGQLQ